MPIDEALRDKDAKVIGTRWVISNKGDLNKPDVRARLVAQEVGTHSDTSFFASTPLLEAKRMLFSEWATSQTSPDSPLTLSFVDVRKAYVNGTPARRLYVRLPTEMGVSQDDGCQAG